MGLGCLLFLCSVLPLLCVYVHVLCVVSCVVCCVCWNILNHVNVSYHATRIQVTIMPKDIQLARRIRGERA